jgi:flagellar biosynthetic protein FliR
MSPVIGGSEIPVQVRALFVFTLTLLIMPSQWFLTITEPKNLTAYAILIVAELGIGLSLGLGLNLFFTGASMAGELIGQIGGLTASQIFDPISGDQTPLLSRMFQYLAITVFAAVGGLHVLITSLLDTFQTLPPGEAAFQPTITYSLVMILGLSFNLSIRIAAPVMVAVLVAMLVMGLLGKTLPQLNLMSVGFGINSMIMFAVMALSLGAGIWCFQERIDDVFQLLFNGLHAIAEP